VTPDNAGFSVQPATLESAAQAFDDGATQLTSTLQSLVSRLLTDGACWGSDEPGQTFSAGYQPARDQLLEDLADLSTGLTQIGEGLHSSALQYQLADQLSAGNTSGDASSSATSAFTTTPASPVTATTGTAGTGTAATGTAAAAPLVTT
jgi:uncharacterized protein YukE